MKEILLPGEDHVVYLLAFRCRSVLVAVVGVKAPSPPATKGPPAAAKVQAGEFPRAPEARPRQADGRRSAEQPGSEVTDVPAPYEVLSESGAFNVYAAAPEREAATLSGGLDVLPQLSLAELDRRLGVRTRT